VYTPPFSWTTTLSWQRGLCAQVRSGQVSLRLTVSQSVCLDVEPHLGLMTRYSLCALVTRRVMLVVDFAPARVIQARQVNGQEPDKV
jgi:hypothetical protein